MMTVVADFAFRSDHAVSAEVGVDLRRLPRREPRKGAGCRVDTPLAPGRRPTMLACLETLRDDVRLRSLLGAYRQFQVERPAAEWHDRVMEIPKVDADRLSRLHGYALASGWIDTRVDRASFTASGQIVNCYRLTREGAAALRVIDEDLEDVDAI